MIDLLKRVWTGFLVVVSFLVGRKTADLEHENAALKAVEDNAKKSKKTINEINKRYNEIAGDPDSELDLFRLPGKKD